jgi:putative serine protease PepD
MKLRVATRIIATAVSRRYAASPLKARAPYCTDRSGLGFAIPVDNAIRIAAELAATGRASHGWLGAQVSGEMTIRGVTIVEVTPDSPAAAAGLTPGTVVTQVDDQVIANGDALVAATQSRSPGTSVALVFSDTSGRANTVKVRLGTDRGQE